MNTKTYKIKKAIKLFKNAAFFDFKLILSRNLSKKTGIKSVNKKRKIILS